MRATANYPEREVTAAILGLCRFSARIGYNELRTEPTIHPNLTTAQAEAPLVRADIVGEQSKEPLKIFPEGQELPRNNTASPLGLIDKSDGSK